MKRFHAAVVLVPMAAFAAVAMLTAQDLSRAQSRERVDLAMVAKIPRRSDERSKVLETFNYITNVTGARPTGSRAHKQAADYVRRSSPSGGWRTRTSSPSSSAAAGSWRSSRSS